MKVKIFSSVSPEELELKVNHFLSETPWITVKQVTQSSNENITLTLWYEDPDVPMLG